MTALPSVCGACPVASRAVCAVLSEEDRTRLAAYGTHRRYRRGETILAAGDRDTAYATLVSGAAKLSSIDSDGVERIVALIHPAGFVGQLFAAENTHHATALSDSEVCVFPRAAFEGAVTDHPELARRLLDETLKELDASRTLIDLLGKRQSASRVAALLLIFSRAASNFPCHEADAFDLPVTRGDMAQLLGLTIETVSRQLTALEAQGLIERRGLKGIAIVDRAGLQTMVA
jgi:CRP/FNR family transcriptional regulator, anaerobic regulatory protein